MITDSNEWMQSRFNLDIPYKVIFPERRVWKTGGAQIRPGSIIFYTDGSKMTKVLEPVFTAPERGCLSLWVCGLLSCKQRHRQSLNVSLSV